MTNTRILIGTTKGAFVMTAPQTRDGWTWDEIARHLPTVLSVEVMQH